jgi:tetratricopeptide (TPR) repeat protein
MGCSVSTRHTPPKHVEVQLAAVPANMPPAAQVAQNRTLRLPTTIVTPQAATDVEELFVAGQTLLRQGDDVGAAGLFDRILQHDPAGPFSERALFQGALAHEASGDLEGAALRFEQLQQRFPQARRASDALLRSMRLRLHLEQWAQAGAAAATYLDRYPDAAPRGRIVALAARALGLLDAERLPESEHFIGLGMRLVDELGLDRAGRIDRDLAQLYFALGEARRRRAEAVVLSADVHEFSARLEQRCQLLLAAQSAYSDSMRAYDAHWSTVAGYRVGELYEQLHEELVAIPAPRAGTQRERQLVEGVMRLRYSVLLNKASGMLDHTLAMARRTGEVSPWVERIEQSRANLGRALTEEQLALDRLPFTRAELRQAMDDLARRAATEERRVP